MLDAAIWKPLKVSEVYSYYEKNNMEQLETITHNSCIVVHMTMKHNKLTFSRMIE